ncbi:hypothetical protein [Mameliella sp. MMSF_3537]|uniref:hypothetical protein n=1 Tax=Mameliella sp. MMSF_3537 TaxID=3046721 RepID=UPI00273DC9DE|nr:hypothetical protein [Mameliella sp. MMSF_3537]
MKINGLQDKCPADGGLVSLRPRPPLRIGGWSLEPTHVRGANMATTTTLAAAQDLVTQKAVALAKDQ